MRQIFLVCMLFYMSSPLVAEISSNSIVFSDIYERGEWGVDNNKKGNSGSGSDPVNAKMYIAYLETFLTENKIGSVVDLGCGDWRIGSCIDWGEIKYIGIDVVSSVIDQNQEKYATSNITFVKADGSDYSLPEADLLICKDVLQHLPYMDIRKIINQFGKFKYCIIVNDVDPVNLTCLNKDIPRGHYRMLDLTKPPFSMGGRKSLTYTSGLETKQLLLITNQ